MSTGQARLQGDAVAAAGLQALVEKLLNSEDARQCMLAMTSVFKGI
ncbi:hypothetical protein ALQ18_00225 [Pseudomonas marginalis pv. marginalis]|nr:hypothetical protein ALQ18_00225 [Pseudomonas marginalis pv. marginalis]